MEASHAQAEDDLAYFYSSFHLRGMSPALKDFGCYARSENTTGRESAVVVKYFYSLLSHKLD